MARWSLTDSEAGAFFAVQFAASLVAGFSSGGVVARVGDRRTVSTGLACMAAGVAGIAAGSSTVALVFISLCGVGIGLTVPTTNMLVARTFRSTASAAVSAVNLAWGAGAALWPLAVTFFGAGRPLLIALALVLSGGAVFALRTTDRGTLACEDLSPARPRSPKARQWTFFAMFFFLYGGSEAAVGGWMTELTHRLNAAAPAAVAAAAFWGGLTAGRAVVATLVSNDHEALAALTGGLLAILSVSALAVVGDARTAIAAGALAGFGLAPLFPITVAILSRTHAGHGAGPLISMSAVGGAVLPWLVGFTSTRVASLQAGLFVPLAGCLGIGFLHGIFWLSPRRHNAL
jgi:fucose permease